MVTAAATAAASSSSRPMSSRSWSAVRARVGATPGPSSSSSSGSTRRRTRTRVKAGSALCGSSHARRPSTWQAVTVSSRRTSSSGRAKTSNPRRMPARDRPPEPRARPSSTVSAWSSRVWPSRTTAAEGRSATSSSTAYRASRAAASGPSPAASTRTVAVIVSSAPSAAICSTTRAAWSADPAWSPWSTVTPTTRWSRLWPSKTAARQQGERVGAAAAGHHDRRPGGQLVEHGAYAAAYGRDRGVQAHRTPQRTRVIQASGSPISDLDGRFCGLGPDGVEVVHADLVDDVAHEGGAVAVLRHLGVEAEQPAQDAVEGADALAALVEAPAGSVDDWGSPSARRRPSPRRRGPRAATSRR